MILYSNSASLSMFEILFSPKSSIMFNKLASSLGKTCLMQERKSSTSGHSSLNLFTQISLLESDFGGGRIMAVSPNTPDQLTLETAFLRLLQYFHNELFPSQHFFPWHFPSYLPMSLKQIYHQLSRP